MGGADEKKGYVIYMLSFNCIPKTMVQFCYSRLYLGTETVSCACGLLLRKANLVPGRVISLCDPGIEVDRHGLKLAKKLDQLPQVCQHACTNRQKNYIMAGAHKPERATSMYSCAPRRFHRPVYF